MSLPKIYNKLEHQWHNNTTPSINEDELNAISSGLSDLDDRVIMLAGNMMEVIPVIQQDLEILEPAIENIDSNVTRAETAADNAEAEALKSEGYAVGTQDGVEVTSGEYYQNNAKYYANIANPPIENTVDFTDIITITDAINKAAKDVRLKVEAVQDLHGYTKPWVGGAGKNKLKTTGTSTTNVGVSYTVNSDGTIHVNGTADISGSGQDTSLFVVGSIELEGGVTYVLSSSATNDNDFFLQLVGSGISDINTKSGAKTFTPSASLTATARIIVNNGKTVSNITIKPMVCLSTASNPTTFEPYTNICPITGHSEVKVTRAGKNLANLIQGTLNVNTGEWTSSNTRVVTDFVRVEPNKKYKASTNGWAVRNGCYYNKDKEFLFGNTESCYPNVSTNILTVPNNADIAFVRIIYSHSNTSENCSPTDFWYQLEAGETATAYEPYMGEVFTISLDGTRYGGTHDVTSGVLTVTKVYDTIDGSKVTGIATASTTDTMGGKRINTSITNAKAVAVTTIADIISDKLPSVSAADLYNQSVPNVIAVHDAGGIILRYMGASTLADAQTALNDSPVHIVYELATPVTVQLTPTQVYLLYGYNTLFGDCGDISLTYDASGIIHIEEAKLDTETLKTIAATSSDFADFKARIAAL